MRKFLFGLLLAVSAPSVALAAWEKLPALVPVQMGLSCEYMQFFDDRNGWIRGSDGFFVTTDGMNFTRLGPVPMMSNGVYVAKPAPLTMQTWFTVGARLAGTPAVAAMKTTDQGATWVEKPFTVLGAGSITGQVRTFGPSNALVYGYRTDGSNYAPFLAKTTDGGETTTELTLPLPLAAGVNQVLAAAMNGNTILFTQSGGPSGGTNSVQRSIDGGQTWTPIMMGSTNVEGFLQIQFTDSMHAFAWGTQGVRSSSDGGATWSSPVAVPLKSSPVPALFFHDPMNGLIGGQDATSNAAVLLRTRDGGTMWAPDTLPADWAGTAESVNCLSWPGPSAYAGPRNGMEKVWLKNATAGGMTIPPGTGAAGSSGSSGTTGGGMPMPPGTGAAGTSGSSATPYNDGNCAIGGRVETGFAALLVGIAALLARRSRRRR